MGAKTEIAWTSSTWNPIRGCSRVSEGCRNCYAERVAARFSGPGKPYEGLAIMQDTGPKWTGKVRLVEEHLEDPLRWRRPRRIFVNSMSDLFHESLSRTDISRVFGVMGQAPHHTFQVLTKRAEGMRKWFETSTGRIHGGIDIPDYPFPNVWLGVSVENQETADERIPELLRTPAVVRFLSVEPQLGPVDLRRFLRDIHWVIVGGESGPGARPFDIAWARSIVEHCKGAGVPVFVKQLGAVPVMAEAQWRHHHESRTPLLNARNEKRAPEGTVPLQLHDTKGGNWLTWPEDLRIREFPAEAR